MDKNDIKIALQIRRGLDQGLPAERVLAQLSQQHQRDIPALQNIFLDYMRKVFSEKSLSRTLTRKKYMAAAERVLNGEPAFETAVNFGISYHYFHEASITLGIPIARPGLKSLLSDRQIQDAASRKDKGASTQALAAELNVSQDVLAKALRRYYAQGLLHQNGFASFHTLQQACAESPVYLILAPRDYEELHI